MMKKIGYVFVALLMGCGAAAAKDAKRPAAMTDAEMDAVTAGDILITLPGFKNSIDIPTPIFNAAAQAAGTPVNTSSQNLGGFQVFITSSSGSQGSQSSAPVGLTTGQIPGLDQFLKFNFGVMKP